MFCVSVRRVLLLFRRLQNLLNNHEENLRKLTNRLNATQDFENKVKKFFGENEEFHKKRVGELSKGVFSCFSRFCQCGGPELFFGRRPLPPIFKSRSRTLRAC